MAQSPLRLDLLHAIRLRGLVEAAELSRLVGTTRAVVRDQLEVERTGGTVLHHGGRLSGWALTASGREEEERLLQEELDLSGQRPAIESLYSDFLALNSELLAICADWQVVTIGGVQQLNDHVDPAHDRRVLGRLRRLHRSAVPLADRLEMSSRRFGGYAQRLTEAHERIFAGETEWLTRSTIDSYHSVWFELHENLLANLGRRRSEERQR